MQRPVQTLPPDHFDAIYAADPDPWRFATSPYERSKYAATLAALPKPRYASAFEAGCSIGVLTAELASRCDAILSVDAAEAPLIEAKRRCENYPSVRFERMFIPGQWPAETFDLVVLSEIVYYLSAEDVGRLASRVAGATNSGADIVLVHWTGDTDYPLSGDEAAELFIASLGSFAKLDRAERHHEFRLDLLTRR
jgi:trans-aconitate methyltransferase